MSDRKIKISFTMNEREVNILYQLLETTICDAEDIFDEKYLFIKRIKDIIFRRLEINDIIL